MSGEVNRPGGEINHENEVKQPGVNEKGGESAGYRSSHIFYGDASLTGPF